MKRNYKIENNICLNKKKIYNELINYFNELTKYVIVPY